MVTDFFGRLSMRTAGTVLLVICMLVPAVIWPDTAALGSFSEGCMNANATQPAAVFPEPHRMDVSFVMQFGRNPYMEKYMSPLSGIEIGADSLLDRTVALWASFTWLGIGGVNGDRPPPGTDSLDATQLYFGAGLRWYAAFSFLPDWLEPYAQGGIHLMRFEQTVVANATEQATQHAGLGLEIGLGCRVRFHQSLCAVLTWTWRMDEAGPSRVAMGGWQLGLGVSLDLF